MRQPLVIGGEQIAALVRRYYVRERVPCLGKQVFQAVKEPVDLAPAAQEDAAQHETEAAFGVRLAVGERER